MSFAEGQAGLSVGRGLLLEGDRPAEAVVVADLDDAGVGQGLGQERLGHLGRGRVGREVHDLDEGLGRARACRTS